MGASAVAVAIIPTSRHHEPWTRLFTLGFAALWVIAAVGVVIALTALPQFHRPKMRIEVGNDAAYRWHIQPTEGDMRLVGASDLKDVDKRTTVIKIREIGKRWPTNVRVDVIAVRPEDTRHNERDRLDWWADPSEREFQNFQPHAVKFAVLHDCTVNELDIGQSRYASIAALRATHYTALLAVSCDGQWATAVEIKCTNVMGLTQGVKESGYPDVEILRTVSLRELDKIVKNRIKSRDGLPTPSGWRRKVGYLVGRVAHPYDLHPSDRKWSNGSQTRLRNGPSASW